jgi:polysaccharide pyruvyl transferase WcaK-like protein
MLLMAEAAARRGVRVSILGFSFNTSPSANVRSTFDSLSDVIAVNVRDRISLERFQRFSRAPSRLVADSAFMLQPDDSAADVRQVIEWAAQRRREGELVLGFNVHPMLFRGATPSQVAALIDSAVTALRRLCERKPVSLLLLSHDYRGADGDHICLGPIARALQPELRSCLMYPTQAFSAAQLKAMAGCADGVVTGRMHLAIASLGMQRPVAALTYQDKFQGLFAHFDYPQRFLLSPQGAADPAQLTALMEDFINQLPALSAKVKRWLPQVTAASALNLDGWLTERGLQAGTDAGLAPLAVQLRGAP